MKRSSQLFFLISLLLLLAFQSYSQQKNRNYINAGYVTNLEACEDCEKADAGFSLRLGHISEKRLGYYVGFIYFKEFHPATIDYDDEGYLFIGGLDYRILKNNNFEWYLKGGLAVEAFVSPYRNSNRKETEWSLKPDFGFLFNIKHFNIILAWQPSDPHHYNVGIGYTFIPKNKEK